jgi:signal peptidase I
MEKGKMKPKAARDAHESAGAINTTPLYILLLVMLVIYVIGQSVSAIAVFSGAAIVMLIIALLLLEMRNGFKETGYARNIIELAGAIAFVIVFWFALRLLLNTPNPIDVVPSCSMLPALQRGDMIILQGLGSAPGSIRAPTVNVTPAQASSMMNGSESLECVAYRFSGQSAYVSQYVAPGDSIGLYRSTASGGEIVPESKQGGNLVKYACGVQQVRFANGTVRNEAYTSSITVLNHTISGDINNSIIVYMTTPSDLFYREGDTFIVHRVYAVLDAGGSYYFLTKGDNNPGLDMQYSNLPPNATQVEGRMILSIPYLGYLKLILSGSTTQPAGCNSTVV